MDAFNPESKSIEPTPLEEMAVSIDLAVGRYLKIPDHKRSHFLNDIKDLAKRLANHRDGDDNIRMIMNSHILAGLPSAREDNQGVVNFITECVKATIVYRNKRRFKDEE